MSGYDNQGPADSDDHRVYDSPPDEQEYDARNEEGNDADRDAIPAVF